MRKPKTVRCKWCGHLFLKTSHYIVKKKGFGWICYVCEDHTK